jgi:4-hydroxy-L-threonine phosphate dehydrogenase PdxA
MQVKMEKWELKSQDVIIPAINQAKGDDIFAFGPFPADGFFGSSMRSNFDAVLAMYHDQGLTAFQSISF